MTAQILAATLLAFCSCVTADEAPSSVWNMPWPVRGYKSYVNVMPIRYDTPAGLETLNFSFSGIKTLSSCPQREIHLIIENRGLPLVEAGEAFLPEDFVEYPDPRIQLMIQPGQMAEITLKRPPPGPWFIVGYLEGAESVAIKQRGLQSPDSCYYFFMALAKQSASMKTRQVLPDTHTEATVDSHGSLFSFQIAPSTINFEVQVLSCEPAPCNLSLNYLTFLASEAVSLTQDCARSSRDPGKPPCVLHVSSPALAEVQIFSIKSVEEKNFTLVFTVLIKECSLLMPAPNRTSCGLTPPLDRIQSPIALTTRFGVVQSSTVSLRADLAAALVTAIPFTLAEPNDVGGTLKWQLRLLYNPQVNISTPVQVCGGLMYNKLPDTELPEFDLCKVEIPGAINWTVSPEPRDEDKTEQTQLKRYVAYPQVGQWHIVLQVHCFSEDVVTGRDCASQVYVEMLLEIVSCVDGECTGRGVCSFSTTGSDLVSFSACQCDADYRGYGCTDDRKAQTRAVQLAGAYLLTLSNLFFLPAIVVALRRGFLLEGFVYFFTMFFSTFYHACDGVRLEMYRMCLTQYDILQLADFFGSACSLWFTLVAMARVWHKQVLSLLQVSGVFGLFVAVIYDRTSMFVIAFPILCGLIAIACSWGSRMYRSKRLYPSWRRYVFYLLPGMVLAGIGGASFAFLETESNYKYVHSVWHACVALSIVLLLPPHQTSQEKYVGTSTSISAQTAPNIQVAPSETTSQSTAVTALRSSPSPKSGVFSVRTSKTLSVLPSDFSTDRSQLEI